MNLLTKEIQATLLENGRLPRARSASTGGRGYYDFLPVVKLFTPDADATWLLIEIEPDDEDRALGLCGG